MDPGMLKILWLNGRDDARSKRKGVIDGWEEIQEACHFTGVALLDARRSYEGGFFDGLRSLPLPRKRLTLDRLLERRK